MSPIINSWTSHLESRRNMSRLQTLAACFLIACGTAGASDLASPSDTKELANSAMRLIIADKINEAFALLKPHWPMPVSEIDALVLTTIQQRNLVAPRFGKSIGFELVHEEALSDFAIRYTFAEKREIHALRWQFTFYKPSALWKVNSVTWDDNFGMLFSQWRLTTR